MHQHHRSFDRPSSLCACPTCTEVCVRRSDTKRRTANGRTAEMWTKRNRKLHRTSTCAEQRQRARERVFVPGGLYPECARGWVG
uniref:Uncharacterized protein n=1 Tax=Anopheles dirus TaxID=7168 RepID=A0A182NYM0_9DIPT